MPPSPEITDLTDHVLGECFDAGSLQRGRGYAGDGRVQLLKSAPGALTATVEGSGRKAYVVKVRWHGTAGRILIEDECTCPLGGACKHVVATILLARAEATFHEPDTTWRRELAAIVGDGHGTDADDPDLVPLALEVVVAPTTTNRRSAVTAPLVTVRPVRLGRNDRWVRSGATWRDLAPPNGYGTRDLRPDQVTALRAMLSAARGHYYPDNQPIEIGAFGSELWFHLERLGRVGVDLVDESGRSGRVHLSPTRAAPSIDLSTGEGGDVLLTVVAALDGSEAPLDLDPARTGILGSPAHGLYVEGAGTLRLVPFTAPIDERLARRLVGPPLTVPHEEIDELLSVYEPLLARAIPVGSSDGSVTISPVEFLGVVMRIERTAVDAATVSWSFRYRRGERITDYSIHQATGALGDRKAETAALQELEVNRELLTEAVNADGSPRDFSIKGPRAITLLAELVPWVEGRGQAIVEVVGSAPALREATNDPLISISVTDPGEPGQDAAPGAIAEQNDWFDLGVDVSIDGETIPFAQLFRGLASSEPVLILPSGTWVRLDRAEFTRLRELIDEARALVDMDGDSAARVNRFQAGWWEDLVALGVVEAQSERWAEQMAAMRELTAPKAIEPPASLKATLRHYQRDGLDWLAFLYDNGLGGILADDMGLGKTVQTIALCLYVLERDPDARFLVVAPTSVVPNWHREASQFAPDVTVTTIHESAARRKIPLTEVIGDARIVVTSYALFRIDFEEYTTIPWNVLLLDEAQFVKNHQSKSYQCARRLDVPTKVAITGTPMENSLMDLWSLLSITAPGLYPDPKRFTEVYRKPIESGKAPELLATLRRRIAPLMRRRTKDDVLTELPPKTEQTVEIELSPKHMRIYQQQLQQQRKKVLGLVGDMGKNRFEIFKSLTILRQLSLDPVLVDPDNAEVGSAKLDRLTDDLVQIVAEGHRALVFSQFTRFLSLARARLDAAGIDHAYLDGRTRNRAEAIDTFTSGAVPVFVISLKAGGFGLNLTQADYCFVLDPWWNPAVETQAVDRAHRIGQTNPVMVYRYVSTGTIEDKVMDLKAKKAALFAEVMDGDGALSGALSEDDIRGLLDLS